MPQNNMLLFYSYQYSEAYAIPCQTPKKECFVKIVKMFGRVLDTPLNILLISMILNMYNNATEYWKVLK